TPALIARARASLHPTISRTMRTRAPALAPRPPLLTTLLTRPTHSTRRRATSTLRWLPQPPPTAPLPRMARASMPLPLTRALPPPPTPARSAIRRRTAATPHVGPVLALRTPLQRTTGQ